MQSKLERRTVQYSLENTVPKSFHTSFALEAYRPHLVSMARRMLRNADDAEDAVQEAYLRTESHREEILSPEPWLIAVVRRVCVDYLRRRQRRHAAGECAMPPDDLLEDARFEPSAHTEREEALRAAVSIILERLTPNERAALVMRDVVGYSYAEIAPVLNKSEDACRQLVHRAKTALQKRSKYASGFKTASPAVTEFVAALRSGDANALLALAMPVRRRRNEAVA